MGSDCSLALVDWQFHHFSFYVVGFHQRRQIFQPEASSLAGVLQKVVGLDRLRRLPDLGRYAAHRVLKCYSRDWSVKQSSDELQGLFRLGLGDALELVLLLEGIRVG